MEKKARVLLADDEETFALATCVLLQQAGYECDVAGDARVASRMLAQADYDVVVADIQMPGNPDLEFVRALAAASAEIPVIIVTGYPSVGTAIAAVELAVSSYLVKPVDFEQLLAAVEEATAVRRAFAALGAARAALEAAAAANPDAPDEARRSLLDSPLAALEDAGLDPARLGKLLARHAPSGDCPDCRRLEDALLHTIDTLRRTKNSFKSKELGQLRRELEVLLKRPTNP